MSSQRYERISNSADDEHDSPVRSTPSSPPPSFRSRASSFSGNNHNDNGERQRLVSSTDADRTLADTFDAPSDDESDDGRSIDERQQAMSGRHDNDDDDVSESAQTPQLQGTRSNSDSRPNARRGSRFAFWRGSGNNAPTSGGTRSGPGLNDGVFANMAAKPERGAEEDEKPPSYEQAAADATPPYWETTIFTPSSSASDEVFIDGLPVGSFFSFIWNGMISLSFQLVGFLLTYLLHTTHAAKNGSKAGLGITLIQYGLNMKRDFAKSPGDGGNPDADPTDPDSGDFIPTPDDPNNHNFDPNASGSFQSGTPVDVVDDGSASGIKPSDWFAYALMIVGWFILIRSLSEYVKARRHEQLVLQSPSRGLNVPVVAEGETSETVA